MSSSHFITGSAWLSSVWLGSSPAQLSFARLSFAQLAWPAPLPVGSELAGLLLFNLFPKQHRSLLLFAMQEPRSDFVSKRASCVIIGRHPNAPREVRVACRQLIGTLLLADCCQQLKIQAASLANKLLSPSEFEAAAGCSKGKNWKVQ